MVRLAHFADLRSRLRHVSSAPSVTYSTGCGRAVTHPGTNPARWYLHADVSALFNSCVYGKSVLKILHRKLVTLIYYPGIPLTRNKIMPCLNSFTLMSSLKLFPAR